MSKKTIYARLGKFGPIVQLGEIIDGGEKPKYAKLRKSQTLDSIDLKSALELFSLPREIGEFDSKIVIVSEGRYGPYIKYNNKFISLTFSTSMDNSLFDNSFILSTITLLSIDSLFHIPKNDFIILPI